MDNENWALMVMDEGQFEDDDDAENPEKALIPAELDLTKGLRVSGLTGDVINEMIEDARTKPLNANQMEAAALVAMGLNDIEVGNLVGVSRKTVNKWKNHNVFFMEVVKKNRVEILESHKVRYRTMIPRAMDVMGEALMRVM